MRPGGIELPIHNDIRASSNRKQASVSGAQSAGFSRKRAKGLSRTCGTSEEHYAGCTGFPGRRAEEDAMY